MEYKSRYPGLMHFNYDELMSRVNHKEENVGLLMKTYFNEFQKSIKLIRTGVKSKDINLIKKQAGLISKSAKAVCFDIMAELAECVAYTGITDTKKSFDIIDDMEVENEYLKDLVEESTYLKII